MAPGEVYFADLDVSGRRPVIVVSRENLNRGRYAVIVPLTSSNYPHRRSRPTCVPFPAGRFGLTVDCVAQCESIATIEIDQIDSSSGPVGVLDDATFREVVRAIGFVIGSDCEPE
jgi:mRNA-degrading endonuclease toxin of MazEF toxin-antitoxin module